NKNNNLILCFEVFSELGKTKLSLQEFETYFQQWVIQMNFQYVFETGNITGAFTDGMSKIVENLNKKYL
ncbi:hypothetical protein, partial [Propionibacterium freudenreichii]|uniref:hypothetical protein n=1 Tax=Propionibacterium freudenreichii TaxID=1744 RepID=UPI0038547121